MSNDFIDDISALDELDNFKFDAPTADEPYAAPKSGGNAPPPAGRFNLQLPTSITVGAWKPRDDQPGSLELQMDSVKVVNPGGPGDGLEMKYISVSTRRIAGENASSATDLLMRAGLDIPRTPSEWVDAANQLGGQVVEGVYCDWEARAPKDYAGDLKDLRKFLAKKGIKPTSDKAGKTLIRGMRNFPKNKDGEPQSKLVFEDAPGGAVTLYANLKPTLRGFGLTEEERAGQRP